MTDASAFDAHAGLRARYLDAMRAYFESPSPETHAAVLQSYFATAGGEDEVSEGVAVKFGMLLANLRKGDERPWATFLSVHVGFADKERFRNFLALSPFSGRVIVEREDHPDGRVTLRGDAVEFLRMLSEHVSCVRREFLISDLNKVRRYVITLGIADTAGATPKN